jgi:hypothetical protein
MVPTAEGVTTMYHLVCLQKARYFVAHRNSTSMRGMHKALSQWDYEDAPASATSWNRAHEYVWALNKMHALWDTGLVNGVNLASHAFQGALLPASVDVEERDMSNTRKTVDRFLEPKKALLLPGFRGELQPWLKRLQIVNVDNSPAFKKASEQPAASAWQSPFSPKTLGAVASQLAAASPLPLPDPKHRPQPAAKAATTSALLRPNPATTPGNPQSPRPAKKSKTAAPATSAPAVAVPKPTLPSTLSQAAPAGLLSPSVPSRPGRKITVNAISKMEMPVQKLNGATATSSWEGFYARVNIGSAALTTSELELAKSIGLVFGYQYIRAQAVVLMARCCTLEAAEQAAARCNVPLELVDHVRKAACSDSAALCSAERESREGALEKLKAKFDKKCLLWSKNAHNHSGGLLHDHPGDPPCGHCVFDVSDDQSSGSDMEDEDSDVSKVQRGKSVWSNEEPAKGPAAKRRPTFQPACASKPAQQTGNPAKRPRQPAADLPQPTKKQSADSEITQMPYIDVERGLSSIASVAMADGMEIVTDTHAQWKAVVVEVGDKLQSSAADSSQSREQYSLETQLAHHWAKDYQGGMVAVGVVRFGSQVRNRSNSLQVLGVMWGKFAKRTNSWSANGLVELHRVWVDPNCRQQGLMSRMWRVFVEHCFDTCAVSQKSIQFRLVHQHCVLEHSVKWVRMWQRYKLDTDTAKDAATVSPVKHQAAQSRTLSNTSNSRRASQQTAAKLLFPVKEVVSISSGSESSDAEDNQPISARRLADQNPLNARVAQARIGKTPSTTRGVGVSPAAHAHSIALLGKPKKQLSMADRSMQVSAYGERTNSRRTNVAPKVTAEIMIAFRMLAGLHHGPAGAQHDVVDCDGALPANIANYATLLHLINEGRMVCRRFEICAQNNQDPLTTVHWGMMPKCDNANCTQRLGDWGKITGRKSLCRHVMLVAMRCFAWSGDDVRLNQLLFSAGDASDTLMVESLTKTASEKYVQTRIPSILVNTTYRWGAAEYDKCVVGRWYASVYLGDVRKLCYGKESNARNTCRKQTPGKKEASTLKRGQLVFMAMCETPMYRYSLGATEAAAVLGADGHPVTELNLQVFCTNPECTAGASWDHPHAGRGSVVPASDTKGKNGLRLFGPNKAAGVHIFPNGFLLPDHKEEIRAMGLNLL